MSAKNVTLAYVVQLAYDVRAFQLLGSPDWLTSDRFDIEAKPESIVAMSQCKLMLRALLAERFNLAVHTGTKPVTVYKLLVWKNGPRMHKISSDSPTGVKTFNTHTGELLTRGITMPQLAGMLSSLSELEKPVVDATGLEGNYEFALAWNPDEAVDDAATKPNLFTALEQQLGLKLEAGKGYGLSACD